MQWRTYQELQDPVLHIGKLLRELWEFMDNGVYPLMLFACVCFAAIAWLLFRSRLQYRHRLKRALLWESCSHLLACLQMLTVDAHA